MKITKIETIRLRRGLTVHAGPIGYLWVRIHTDTGLTGLGETYPHPASEQAVVLERLAPKLIGRDPLATERIWADNFLEVSYSGWAGAEMRAISAISACGSTTTPLPMTASLPGRTTPDGSSESL